MRFPWLGILAVAISAAAAPQKEAAAELSLQSLDGEARSLAAYRGQVVVLNFWATWCKPCREEMPLLEKIHREYTDRGVVVIGASVDAQATEARIAPFVHEHGLTFPIWKGARLSQVEAFVGEQALPATVLLDRQGRIRRRWLGVVREAELRARLEELLAADAAPKSR
ncbi:MAG: TlpA family protein disulfide reductase [Acidobacteriia bacterium]|jgi:peroxiredoxin|nr:TlpA family protein disulfide reductase [Terriglobia bacterium]